MKEGNLSLEERWVLGIWDGHDAGAALVRGEKILVAVNEERLTRRKLEVGFPRLSIGACLNHAGLAPADIGTVAASTTDPAKTLTRLLPRPQGGVLPHPPPEEGPASRRSLQEGLQVPLHGTPAEFYLQNAQPALAGRAPLGDGL